jgi:hypothetical protein
MTQHTRIKMITGDLAHIESHVNCCIKSLENDNKTIADIDVRSNQSLASFVVFITYTYNV